VDILQADDDALAGRNVNARDTSHSLFSMSAEAPDGAAAVKDNLAPVETGLCEMSNGPRENATSPLLAKVTASLS
jgi:hypothetical protein